MIYVISGLALVVIGGLTLALILVRSMFGKVYELLMAEREADRADIKNLRAALFPQLARIAADPAPKRAQAAAPSLSSPQPPAFFNPRIPFRRQFKMLVQQHNTKQKGRDGMAAAIASAKETSHAS